jgi:hypothetical protein
MNEHSEQTRVPPTNESRDVPRCGDLRLLQKPLHFKGVITIHASFCVVGLSPVAARARILVHEVLDHDAQAVYRGAAR